MDVYAFSKKFELWRMIWEIGCVDRNLCRWRQRLRGLFAPASISPLKHSAGLLLLQCSLVESNARSPDRLSEEYAPYFRFLPPGA